MCICQTILKISTCYIGIKIRAKKRERQRERERKNEYDIDRIQTLFDLLFRQTEKEMTRKYFQTRGTL